MILLLMMGWGIIELGTHYVNVEQSEYVTKIRFYSQQKEIIKELNLTEIYGYKTAKQGRYFYFLNSEGINIYNENGERIRLIQDKGMFVISRDDEYLVCASDNTINIYQHFVKQKAVRVISSAIRDMKFLSDNHHLGVMMRNHFTMIDLRSQQELWTKEFAYPLVFNKLEEDKIILVAEKRPSLNAKVYLLDCNGQLIKEYDFQYQQYEEQIQDIFIERDNLFAQTHLRKWVLGGAGIRLEDTPKQNQNGWNWQSKRVVSIQLRSLNLLQDTLPWPISPTNALHPIGNSWAEFQNYGGSSYFHPGVDILSPEVPNVAVYAVKNGYVKAWLSTGNYLYWRLAIADSTLSYTDSCDAYLYAHIDSSRYHKNIGDTVQTGELIGYLVYWPVDSIRFHHIHFAKIRDRGATWTVADWAFVFNPLLSIRPNQDTIPPRFENALGNQQFAFCRNNTSTYLSPNSLNGDVDIIAKIHDKFSVSTGDTIWDRLTPLKIEYEIMGQNIVQNRQLSFIFDKKIPPNNTINVVYKEDNICQSRGDYDQRDYFFIVTNTDGDSVVEATDASYSWQTTNYPNGNYWIKVYASDASDNVSVCSMLVTVANNPAIEEYVFTSKRINSKDKFLYNALGQRVKVPQIKAGVYFSPLNCGQYKVIIIKPSKSYQQ